MARPQWHGGSLVNVLHAFRVLGPIDLKGITRDSFMRWMTGLAIAIGLLTRWGVPALATRIQQQYQVDITPYYTLVMSSLLVLMSALAGVVIGFLLLDEKDDRTLSALQVTPLTLRGYLAYRILEIESSNGDVSSAKPIAQLAIGYLMTLSNKARSGSTKTSLRREAKDISSLLVRLTD